MEAQYVTFKQLFDVNQTNLNRIVIPRIQRAYAQGRRNARAARVREKFLDAILDAINGSPKKVMTLDFVYGQDDNGTLIPLDGQQRLTTLFLLHWYAGKADEKLHTDVQMDDKAAETVKKYDFLRNFTYCTRYSARDFCKKLIDFTPSLKCKLSDEIVDDSWFPLDWKNDATIDSMLVMLDAIDEKFKSVSDLWEALDYIKFYFLPIEEMGLTDDIYIKMNSRGKPLTDFEHFKAEFEKAMKEVDKAIASRISRKIDIDWTNILWEYRGKENVIDDKFLRFFRFVCDIICYKDGNSPKHKDEFELINLYFRGEKAKDNLLTLETYFDCWKGSDNKSIFDTFISVNGHEPEKILLRNANQQYLFQDCLDGYADVLGNKNRKFTLNQIILLYAFTQYRLSKGAVDEKQFARRLRIIYNLVLNSNSEISDSESRVGGNRMPAILKQVDSIILHGKIEDNITIGNDNTPKLNFNANQLKEEQSKLRFTESEHPEMSEALFDLEDHPLINGQVDIVGLENYELFKRFSTLFDCDLDLIDCALLSIGDYSRRDNDWRIQLGTSNKCITSAWRSLFDKSNKAKGYDHTKNCLTKLLSHQDISTEYLKDLASKYIGGCEADNAFDWRYYYIKYPSFRMGRHGKMQQYADRPYEMTAIYAEQYLSSNSKQVFLNEMKGIGNVDSNDNGNSISLNDGTKRIRCLNNAYALYDQDGNEIERIEIQQNEDGVDVVDRIVFGCQEMKKWLDL